MLDHAARYESHVCMYMYVRDHGWVCCNSLPFPSSPPPFLLSCPYCLYPGASCTYSFCIHSTPRKTVIKIEILLLIYLLTYFLHVIIKYYLMTSLMTSYFYFRSKTRQIYLLPWYKELDKQTTRAMALGRAHTSGKPQRYRTARYTVVATCIFLHWFPNFPFTFSSVNGLHPYGRKGALFFLLWLWTFFTTNDLVTLTFEFYLDNVKMNKCVRYLGHVIYFKSNCRRQKHPDTNVSTYQVTKLTTYTNMVSN